MFFDEYITQQSMWHCILLLTNSMESNDTITTQNSALHNEVQLVQYYPIETHNHEGKRLVAKTVLRV